MKTKMATPARERERRLNSSNRVKGPTAVEIENIENEALTQEARERLVADTKRWKKLGEGAHLDAWLAFGPGLQDIRRVTMLVANVNKPEGKGYNKAFGQVLAYHGMGTMDKASITALLWLYDDPARLAELQKIREDMTDGQRSRLSSPISARQRVYRALDGKLGAGGAEDREKPDPNMPAEKINELKKQVVRLAQEVAVANDNIEHLWGGLTSYCQAAPENDVVDTLLKHMEPEKVQAVCVAALKALGLTVRVSGGGKRKRSPGELAWKNSGLTRREYQRRQKEQEAVHAG